MLDCVGCAPQAMDAPGPCAGRPLGVRPAGVRTPSMTMIEHPEETQDANPFEEFKRQLPDSDPEETAEWIQALDGVVEAGARERAYFLLRKVLKRARQLEIGLGPLVNTPYINTISPEQEPDFPGDEEMELRVRRMIRWNAAVMVLRANQRHPGIGGRPPPPSPTARPHETGFN